MFSSAVIGSLSARRAWIEMGQALGELEQRAVALRKESVDRNVHLSALDGESAVALRKESVDRNVYDHFIGGHLMSRSPQGERG